MAEANVAMQHLVDAVLTQHRANNSEIKTEDSDFFDFTEAELNKIVESLWVDRYSTSRRSFEDTVSQIIANKVING